MSATIIHNATIINEGKTFSSDILIKNQRIEKIAQNVSVKYKVSEVHADGLHLLPGMIDDQVHFREPGLSHKGDIYTESRAAAAGGITSFMEMPNTIPNVLTQELLNEKYELAGKKALANFSFYMGAGNHNLEEVLKTDAKNVCGIKIFMGSSTGDMLVDNEKTLEGIFSKSSMLIATHCEDERTIRNNMEKFRQQYGEQVPVQFHPEIRSEEACFISSSLAVQLARKYGTRLHILHISTAREINLFENNVPLENKKITAEACIHHLWFSNEDYDRLGNKIKWNPAIKTLHDRNEILKAVLEDKIDVIATDHAPHTEEEKNQSYFKAPSGGPLVQHALVALLELYHRKKISLEELVCKIAHAPAICFQVKERGFIREGHFADLVLVNLNEPWTVNKQNILYKCNWSPFEGETFQSKIKHTFISGAHVFKDGFFDESVKGCRLEFNRN